MFKLESYVAPLLMGYIDKYVKLNKDDFQLSLWGGDVVLNKLELRLEFIESLIKIPISLRSGWVHELRVHVPWTHLYSEPVVITINTIECTVKLKSSDLSSESSSVAMLKSNAGSNVKKSRSSPALEGQEELPPGYLQSLLNKIVNNMNIVVNNLILKFVDDDIVLSLNIKSAECYSVDALWNRSFVDLTAEDLVLRRVLEVHDLTLCLDKRNASGKIEHYQTPLLYRCVLFARLAMSYDSLYSKIPYLTKLNIICDSFNFSLTDIQIPMFYKLFNLFLSFYYETYDIQESQHENEKEREDVHSQNEMSNEDESTSDDGWISWAWSYVPPILSSNTGSDLDTLMDMKKKAESAILTIGFHIKQVQIYLKHCIISRSGGQSGFEKMSFETYVVANISKVHLDVKLRGNTFVDVQFGIKTLNTMFHCNCLENSSADETSKFNDLEFFKGGSTVIESDDVVDFHNSLFDEKMSVGSDEVFVFSEEEHVKLFSEKYAQQNFNFFWMNFIFTMEQIEDDPEKILPTSLNILDLKEKSLLRFFVGKFDLKLTTRLLEIIKQLLSLISDSEPAQATTKHESEEIKQPPSKEDLLRLEMNAVTCRYNLVVIQPSVYLFPTNTQMCLHRCQKSHQTKKKKSGVATQPAAVIAKKPAILLQCGRMEWNFSMPMYSKIISRTCSLIVNPSDQVMHNCHSHMHVQISKLAGYLVLIENHVLDTRCIIQPLNLMFHQKSLLHTCYWKNNLQARVDSLLEGENMTVNLTKAQLLVVSYVIGSWMSTSSDCNPFYKLSLLNDVFSKEVLPDNLSVEVTVPSFELHHVETSAVHAFSGCITSFLVLMLGCKNGKQFLLPVLYGPLDLAHVHSMLSFSSKDFQVSLKEGTDDLVSFSCQFQKNSTCVEAPGGIFVRMQGMSLLLDPVIFDWLAYTPKEVTTANETSNEFVINSSIALATDPLMSSFLGGSESGSRTLDQSFHVIDNINSNATDIKNGNPQTVENVHSTWQSYFCNVYSLLRILEIELNIQTCCLFTPLHNVRTTTPPTVDIPLMLHSIFSSKHLSDVFVFVLPVINLVSSGVTKRETIPGIPIKMLEHSLAGDKLPWKLILSDMSVYSLHDSDKIFSLLDSFTLSCTLALNAKYKDAGHMFEQEVVQLACCLHCDINSAHISLSSKQMKLAGVLINKLIHAVMDTYNSFECLFKLLDLNAVEKNGTAGRPPKTNIGDRRQDSPRLISLSSLQEAGREVSVGVSDDASLQDVESPKKAEDSVSLWFQLTFDKLVLEFILPSSNKKDFSLICEFNDLASSMDFHESYIKFKSKVNSVLVKKVSDNQLILLTNNVSFPQHLQYVLTSKVTSPRNESKFHFSDGIARLNKSPAGFTKSISLDESVFFSFVFTRVNADHSFEKFTKTYDGTKFKASAQTSVLSRKSYVDEVCVTLQPFFVVFDFHVLTALLQLCEVVTNMSLIDDKKDIDSSPPAPARSENTQLVAAVPLFSSSDLPLIHFLMKGFYAFIPRKDPFGVGRSDVTEKILVGDPGDSAESRNEVDDTFVVYVDSLEILPYADNPLPRMVVEKEVYARALELGVFGSFPGYPLEDRQYQALLVGFAVASTSWENVFGKLSSIQSSASALANVVQNPAFEWNSSSGLRRMKTFNVSLITSCLNVQVTFAPAITMLNQHQSDEILVCGHSLEINATSEIELCILTSQVKLLSEMVFDLVSITSIKEEKESIKKDFNAASISQNDNLSPLHFFHDMVPFDMLMTGIRLNVVTYIVDQVHDPNKAASFFVKPFLSCLISQPYFLIKHNGNSMSKFELSCYDMNLKSNSSTMQPPTRFEPNLSDFRPDYVDFTCVVMETKQGRPDVSTGVLPSLCTCSVVGSHHDGIGVDVKIDRPVKVTFSKESFELLSEIIPKISDAVGIFYGASEKSKTDGDGISEEQKSNDNRRMLSNILEVRESFKWLKCFNVKTVQFVFAWNFKIPKQDFILKLAVSNFQFLMSLQDQLKGSNRQLLCDIKLRDIISTLMYHERISRILGPSVIEAQIILNSIENLPMPTKKYEMSSKCLDVFPCLEVHIHSDSFSLQFSKEDVTHLKTAIQVFTSLMMKENHLSSNLDVNVENRSPDKADGADDDDDESLCVEFHDDLKSGNFVFLNNNEDKMLPDIEEVTFQANPRFSSMTWKYREPRLIDKLTVSPVPFNFDEISNGRNDGDQDGTKIPCVLQYSMNCGKTFEDYALFHVSSSDVIDVRLPQFRDGKKNLVASQLWRAVLSKYTDDDDDGKEGKCSEENVDRKDRDVLSPLVLTSCLKINSKIIPSLIPVFNITLTFGKVDLDMKCLGASPNYKPDSEQLVYHKVAKLRLENLFFNLQTYSEDLSQLKASVSSKLACQLIEYSSLTWLKLLDRASLRAALFFDFKKSSIIAECAFDHLYVVIGQRAVHTLNFLLNSWNDSSDHRHFAPCIIVHNSTQETMYFGQVGTDEVVVLASLQSYNYFWSCLNCKKGLWIGLKKKCDKKVDDVDLERTCQKVVGSCGNVLLVCVEGVGKVEKQIRICGNLVIGSHLDFPTFVKLQTPDQSFVRRLESREVLPSFVVAAENLTKMKLLISHDESFESAAEFILGRQTAKRIIKLNHDGRYIHIWCDVTFQTLSGAKECLIVLSPLLVIRSHYPVGLHVNVAPLQTDDKNLQFFIEGRGRRTALYCLGDVGHDITFQLLPETPASSPVLNISPKTIEDVMEKRSNAVNISTISQQWHDLYNDELDTWPYNAVDDSVFSTSQINSMSQSSLYMESKLFAPNIELSINLTQLFPCAHTLLVDVSPRWMIVNETKLDLIVSSVDTSEFWSIPPSRAFVPPTMTQFIVALLMGGFKHSSDIITLLEDERSSPYQSFDDLHLAVEGHIMFSLPISHADKIIQQMHLSIHSTWKHQMRVLTIREQFLFINHLPYFIELFNSICSTSQNQIDIEDSTPASVISEKSHEAFDVTCSLLLWTFRTEEQSENSYVVCLKASHSKNDSNFPWSCPIRLEVTQTTSRFHVVVPCRRNYDEVVECVPCCLTVHVDKAVVYLVLDEEKFAYLKVFNNCEHPVYLTNSRSTHEEINSRTISSQMVTITSKSSGYFCPHLTSKSVNFLPFNFAIGVQDSESLKLFWSNVLELDGESSVFVKLSDHANMKIESRLVGHHMQLHVTSVVKATIFVKEIRSKMKGHVVTSVESTKQISHGSQLSVTSVSCATSSSENSGAYEGSLFGFKINFSSFFKKSVFLLEDNLKNQSADDTIKSKEILLLTVDKMNITLNPIPSPAVSKHNSHILLTITIDDLQLDNRAFIDGNFDFPVIIISSQEKTVSETADNSSKVPFLKTSFELFVEPNLESFQVIAVNIGCSPFAACLEDIFVYSFLEYLQSFVNSTKTSLQSKKLPCGIPADVKLISNDLANPVRLMKLTIEPLKTFISLRASVKLFLALDSTPMNFGRFEKTDIWLTKQQFSKLLTMHYATSALLRTGVVVGSLEILGNPTGFVRNISNGVFDMIYLPYNGLTLGPASCITGFTNGIKSVVKHFSTGTLTSISNFASGISRNMERLSMDADHVGRIDRMRRRRPHGLSDGLLTGLAGLGLSLLGAVAGIADQPLQMFMSPANDSLSVSSKAKGVVSGFGKGLIGVIAKPIGGAAELVSMTSMGIMHGAGLVKALKQRDFNASIPCGRMRLSQENRILLLGGTISFQQGEELLYCMNECIMSDEQECSILLTTCVMHVCTDSESATLLCSLPITDVHLMMNYNKMEMSVYVNQREENPYTMIAEGSEYDFKMNNERIAEYISRNLHCRTPSISSSEICSLNAPSSLKNMKLKYCFRFKEKLAAAEFFSLCSYALSSKDNNQFVT